MHVEGRHFFKGTIYSRKYGISVPLLYSQSAITISAIFVLEYLEYIQLILAIQCFYPMLNISYTTIDNLF